MASPRNLRALLGFFGLLVPTVHTHTWIEQYQVIGPNGSYIGDNGYTRGYVARTDPTFEGDANILWMLPELSAREPNGDVRLRINSSDLLCHPNQRTSNYSNPAYPKLKAAPGDYVAMKYFENGHVTLPWNTPGKPSMGGTAFVFGTTSPRADEKISDVMKWTADGKGGDGRGVLLTAQNYDDGRCHQINDCVLSAQRQVLFPNTVTNSNSSAELWCETDLLIPTSQTPGSTLTTYWVWQWPTEPGTSCTYADGKDEYYTSCADFDIVPPSNGEAAIAAEAVTNTLLQQDFQSRAVGGFASRTALTTTASAILNEWSTFSAQLSAAATPTLPASFLTSCSLAAASAAAAVKAGVTPGLPPSCPADKWATGALFAEVSASALAQVSASATGSASALVSASASASAPASASASSDAAAAAPTAVVRKSTSAAPASLAATSSLAATTTAAAAATTSTAALVPGASTLVEVSTFTELRTITGLSSGAAVSTAAPTVGGNGAVDDAAMASMSEHCVTMRKHARQFR